MTKLFRFSFLIFALYALQTAWTLRLESPIDPYFSGDTWGYLAPALNALGGDDFQSAMGRNYPYPLFLYLVLKLFGSMASIAVVQHALGLIGLVFLAFSWNEIWRVVQLQRGSTTRFMDGAINVIMDLCLTVCGAVLLWMVGTSPTILLYEQYIGPEALFFPCSSVLLFLLFRFFRRVSQSLRVGRDLCVLIVFNLFLYLIRPLYFVGSFTVAVLPIMVARRVMTWKRLAAIVALSLVTFFVLGTSVDGWLRPKDNWRKTFGPMVLFAFNAPFTAAVLQQDLEANPDQDRALCKREVLERTVASFDAAKKHPAAVKFGPWGVTNIYGDFFIYGDNFDHVDIVGPTGLSVVNKCFENDTEALAAFYWKYSILAVLKYPKPYLKKTFIDLGFYYSPTARRLSVRDYTSPRFLQKTWGLVQELNQTNLVRSKVGAALAERVKGEIPATVRLTYINRNLEKRIDQWFGPLSAVALALLFLQCAVRIGFRRWEHGWWVLPSCWVSAHYMIFATNICISLTHTLFITRYIEGEFIMTAVAAALNVIFIVHSLAQMLILARRGTATTF